MTIGIIGAGNIGQAVAKRLAGAGIPASIANNRGPSSLSSIVQNLGAGITAAEIKVAARADIVFLAVPWSAYADAVAGLAPWGGRIVIDAMNAASLGPEGLRPFDLGGRPSSQIVADRLPGARVVKAFNTLPAAALASDPHADGGRRVLFVSGDDTPARQEVAQLIDRLGFVAIDLGDFEMGRRLQQFPGGPLAGINMVQIP
ncbi:MAG TPA: NAD(P)-binding domain-containing protein [Vicinamibacterales bacterium]|nr:NAD(P)-binding domain-containing protein [Vicinamibacterales bacterium]